MEKSIKEFFKDYPSESEKAEFIAHAKTSLENGDKLSAANLFVKARCFLDASKIFDELGMGQEAYDNLLEAKINDFNVSHEHVYDFDLDKLATKYSIQSHEFKGIPLIEGMNNIESMTVALKSHLYKKDKDGVSVPLFRGKKVLDVGVGDGRFVQILRDLGAIRVVGIDPDINSSQIAIDKGFLEPKDYIPLKLEEIPDGTLGSFDAVVIFNFNISYDDRDIFFKKLYDGLSDEALIVMTFAEDHILQSTRPIMEKYFNLEFKVIFRQDGDYPHKNLVTARKL